MGICVRMFACRLLALAAAFALLSEPSFAADKLAARKLAVTHAGEIYEIEVSRDGRFALTTSTTSLGDSGASDVKLWEIETGRILFSNDKLTTEPPVAILSGTAVKYEPSAENDAPRTLHLAETGVRLASLLAKERALRLDRRGASWLTTTLIEQDETKSPREDAVVRIHDSATGEVARTIVLPGTAKPLSVAGASADGRYIAFLSVGRALVVDTTSGAVQSKKLDSQAPFLLALARDGARLYVYERQPASLTVLSLPDFRTLSTTKIAFEADGPSWKHIAEEHAGELIMLSGTRIIGFADVKTGKTYWAGRGGSVNRFTLRSIDGRYFLRGFRSRNNPTTWGVISHAKGDFKELYKVSSRIALGSLTASPNGKCLTVVSDGALSIVDPLTRRELGKAGNLPKSLYRGDYAGDGRAFIVSSIEGALYVIATPKVCHG